MAFASTGTAVEKELLQAATAATDAVAADAFEGALWLNLSKALLALRAVRPAAAVSIHGVPRTPTIAAARALNRSVQGRFFVNHDLHFDAWAHLGLCIAQQMNLPGNQEPLPVVQEREVTALQCAKTAVEILNSGEITEGLEGSWIRIASLLQMLQRGHHHSVITVDGKQPLDALGCAVRAVELAIVRNAPPRIYGAALAALCSACEVTSAAATLFDGRLVLEPWECLYEYARWAADQDDAPAEASCLLGLAQLLRRSALGAVQVHSLRERVKAARLGRKPGPSPTSCGPLFGTTHSSSSLSVDRRLSSSGVRLGLLLNADETVTVDGCLLRLRHTLRSAGTEATALAVIAELSQHPCSALGVDTTAAALAELRDCSGIPWRIVAATLSAAPPLTALPNGAQLVASAVPFVDTPGSDPFQGRDSFSEAPPNTGGADRAAATWAVPAVTGTELPTYVTSPHVRDGAPLNKKECLLLALGSPDVWSTAAWEELALLMDADEEVLVCGVTASRDAVFHCGEVVSQYGSFDGSRPSGPTSLPPWPSVLTRPHIQHLLHRPGVPFTADHDMVYTFAGEQSLIDSLSGRIEVFLETI